MEFNRICNRIKSYSDQEYISGLKKGNQKVIQSFFYSLCCFTINDIRWSLMQGRVDYDELVNELYLYLSCDGWHKLDTFEGKNNCTLKSWVVRLAWRFFIQQRSRLLFNGNSSENSQNNSEKGIDDSFDQEIRIDVESTFLRMPNKRYMQVLIWMLKEGYDANEVAQMLETTVSNVYNIKHRAIVQFIETYNQ